jgi:hypothetical protein
MNCRINPPETREIYQRLKQSAKRRKIDFTLTIPELNNLSFPITCPVLGMPLKWHRGTAQDDSYSFDRIDSSKGYTIDNIEIISVKANRAKNDLTDSEIQLFCNYYKN